MSSPNGRIASSFLWATTASLHKRAALEVVTGLALMQEAQAIESTLTNEMLFLTFPVRTSAQFDTEVAGCSMLCH